MTEKHTILKNVRLIDAAAARTDACDIHFVRRDKGSEILRIGRNLRAEEIDGLSVVNVHGTQACPPFTDLRCAAPDGERELMKTVLFAANAGGYGTVLFHPTPAASADTKSALLEQKKAALAANECEVCTAVPVTKGGKGQRLCDFSELRKAGAVAVTDECEENDCSSGKLLDCLEAVERENLLFLASCRRKSIDARGTVNKGKMSAYFGDRGIDPASELLALSQALILASQKNVRVHFPIVTLQKSVELIRAAKAAGVRITCGTAPAYFSFSEDELIFSGSMAKLDPPLRGENDRLAVIEGLRDRTVDCICSDHTPCKPAEKSGKLTEAAFGAVGLETVFGAGVTNLVMPGYLSIYRLIELMSIAPASIIGRECALRIGAKADIVLIDPEAELVYVSSTMRSHNSNTPFYGKALHGRATSLYLNGLRQF